MTHYFSAADVVVPRVVRAAARRATAHGRAKATYDVLRAYAARTGHDPDREIFVRREGANKWRVSYEAGPDSWGVAASYGLVACGITAVPDYSFDLIFYGD
jgi:5-enolpyruvylshikimate-3-phosphate synthase